VNEKEFRNARDRANPFEDIGKSVFLDRASLKIASIDALMNFSLFFDEKDGESFFTKYSSEHPFLFADVCSGPGGFSEYIFWRMKRRAIGLGMTLRGMFSIPFNPFNPIQSHSIPFNQSINLFISHGNTFQSTHKQED
jgi:cap1 methyltransferase